MDALNVVPRRTACLLLLTGCAHGFLPLPDITWTGEHLEFGTDDPDARVCGGTLEYMDETVGKLGELFDQPDARVRFYLLTEHDLTDYGRCDIPIALACARGSEVYSTVIPQEHELVHAVRKRSAHVLLEEGVAELFGDSAPRPPLQDDVVTVAMEYSDRIPWSAYPRAGHFASYLVETHGLPRLLEVLDATAYGDDYAALAEAFAGTYGMSFEAMAAAYAEAPECGHDVFRQVPLGCDRPPDAVETCDQDIALEGPGECEAEGVLGVRDGLAWREWTVELQTSGLHLVSASQPPEGTEDELVIKQCMPGCGGALRSITVKPGDVADVQFIDLPAGTYVVGLGGSADYPHPRSLLISSTCPP